MTAGPGNSEAAVGVVKRAEPDSEPHCSPVLRRNEEPTGEAERPGAERPSRAARPGLPLPCLFVTTATDEERKVLPGPLKKQMEAWTQNVKWMAETFGADRLGFLTLTLGDVDSGGRYRNLKDRKEAQRRFHSLMAGIIAKRYQCGGTITERHRNGGIHFHLAVVCKSDIRGQIDFGACFPAKDNRGKYVHPPDYSTAPRALREEWAFWRRIAKLYGFGRCQMQPVKSTGEAVGRYLAGYMMKDHRARLPEDKGARCVRMFGHWHGESRKAGERAMKPPFNSRISKATARRNLTGMHVRQANIQHGCQEIC